MNKLTGIKDYLAEIAFIALMVRIVAVGCGIGEALAVISLVCSIGYVKYLNRQKSDLFQETNKKIDELASQVQALKIDRSMRRTVNEPQTQKRIF